MMYRKFFPLFALLLFLAFGFQIKNSDHPFFTNLSKSLETHWQVLSPEKLYLQIDRPQYKPGDQIWFKAYLRDASSLKQAESNIVYVELLDPKGNEIYKYRLKALDGLASNSFQLASSAVGGRYKIRAYSQWMQNTDEYFERDLVVQNTVLPRLLMKLEFDRKAFGPDDLVEARFDVYDLTNRPLSNQTLEVVLQLDGNIEQIVQAQTNAQGRAYLNTKLPADLATSDGLLRVQLNYRSQLESISRAIPIKLGNIDLQFLPEGGQALAGLHNKYAFKALDEWGDPADVSGQVYDESGQEVAQFTSYHNGMGVFEFRPKAGKNYYAKLNKPSTNTQEFPLPIAHKEGYQLSIKEQTPKGLQLELSSTSTMDSVFVLGMARGKIYFQRALALGVNQAQRIFVPTTKWPMGIASLSLFDARGKARCERLAFINQQHQLQIEIETNKEKYLPREKVDMTISVKDEKGKPVMGDFSIAVVDDNLLTTADDRQGHLLSHIFLESELKAKIHEPNFYFDPEEEKAALAMDHLMLSQGWRSFDWSDLNQEEAIAYQFTKEKAEISGKVLGPDGKIMAGAKVRLVPAELKTTTDENGRFCITDHDLQYISQLIIEGKNGYGQFPVLEYSQDQEYRLKQRAFTILYPGGKPEFKGQVTSQRTTKPLASATVSLVRYGQIIQTTQADKKGYYQFNIPEKGVYDIRSFHAEEGALELSHLFIDNKRNHQLNLALPPWDETNKTYKRRREFLSAGIAKDEVMEMAPPRVMAIPPPPPPPPPVIEEIPMEEIIEEEEAVLDEVRIVNLGIEDDIVLGEVAADRAMPIPPPPPPPPPPANGIEAEIFKVVEEMPMFPGCDDLPYQDRKKCADAKLLDYLYQRLDYPALAQANAVQGTVVVQFTVEKDGSIKGARVVRDIGAGCGNEALAIIEQMADEVRWQPGKQRGRPVPVQFNLPIRFNLDQRRTKIDVGGREGTYPMVNLQSYQEDKEFYHPKYKKGEDSKEFDDRVTLYWNPQVKTDKKGIAQLSFYAGDVISSFRTTVEGFGQKGQAGRQEKHFYTQPRLAMDGRMVAQCLLGDTLKLALRLSNFSSQERCGKLSIHIPDGLQLLDDSQRDICLSSQTHENLYLPVVATEANVTSTIKINYRDANTSLDWETDLQQLSRGFPVEQVIAGDAMENEFDIHIQDPIRGTMQAELRVYPHVLGEMLTGMERMLRQPHGCFEQVSSSNYPNLLVLDYLKQTDQPNSQLEDKARAYLKDAYAKLTAYESPNGGFHWWGSDPGHEALTAYGILQFRDMAKVFPVDEEMIRRNANWLLNRRDGRGSWLSGTRHLHSWQVGPGVLDAFIVWALSEAGLAAEIQEEFEFAYRAALGSKDPYQLGLMANAALAANDDRSQILIDQILATNQLEGAWSGKTASVVCSKGKALQVETTALAALALIRANQDDPALNRAIRFIASAKSGNGYGNTQATVLALKALSAYAKFKARPSHAGTIIVEIDGQEVARQTYEPKQKEAIRIAGLAKYLKDGNQQIKVRFADTKESLPFDLSLAYNVRTPASNPTAALNLETQLLTNEARVGETVRLEAELTNKTAQHQASPMLRLGIPAGLSPQTWQLKQILDRKQADYYEIVGGYINFYFESIGPEEKRDIKLDLKVDVAGHYEAPASCAYLYYADEDKSWASPGRLSAIN